MHACVDQAGNFVAERGKGPRALLLLGHIDTVQGFFPPKLVDGKLYGRGSVDAKGPLAAFFLAAARLQDTTGLTITMIGAVEEEAPSSKGARHILNRYQPDYVIVGEPSGAASMTLGYKGRVGFRYEAQRAHAHTAAAGRSLAAEAVTFWTGVEDYCLSFNDRLETFERLDAHLARFNTTTNGLLDRVDIDGSFRLPLGFELPNLETRLHSLVGESASLTMYGYQEAYKAGKRNALVRAFLSAIRAEGMEPRFKVKTGTSDMNIVGPVWQCPIVAYGPGDSRLDHTPDEHVGVDEYLRSIQVLGRVIEQLRLTAVAS
ncbi:MAG: [LysW]-lysine hydrolase, partial [Acidimicrobiia bacterium]